MFIYMTLNAKKAYFNANQWQIIIQIIYTYVLIGGYIVQYSTVYCTPSDNLQEIDLYTK